MADHCDISVVIPVFNEAQNLGQLLGRILSLEFAGAKLILVENSSREESGEIAEKRGVKVILRPCRAKTDFREGLMRTIKGYRMRQSKTVQ